MSRKASTQNSAVQSVSWTYRVKCIIASVASYSSISCVPMSCWKRWCTTFILTLPHPRTKASAQDGIFRCGCCGKCYSSMVFHCVSCKFNLDPKRALRTFSAFQDGVASEIQHFGHNHPFIIYYIKEKQIPDNCRACCEPATGLAYRCESCVYVLHKSCAELPLHLERPFHPSHPLTKIPAKDFICNYCHSESPGFVFCCTECDFYLCKECASKRPP